MVTFNTLKTQKNKDVVEIYDGTSKQLITILSGVYSKAIPFTSESNVIDIRFISDGSENSEGFSASYQQVSKCNAFFYSEAFFLLKGKRHEVLDIFC